MKREEIVALLEQNLSQQRLEHTLGVEKTAIALAKKYNEDEKRASVAALLHDYYRYLTAEEYLQMAKEYGVEISPIEEQTPMLLHGKLAAYFAQEQLGIIDEEILSAIFSHTFGKKQMSKLDKIIYLADFIEPNRKGAHLKPVKEMAQQDLDKAVHMALQASLDYLELHGKPVMQETKHAIAYIRNEIDEKERE